MTPSRLRAVAAALLALVAAGTLQGCAAGQDAAAGPSATVTVTVAASAHRSEYEVQLHRSSGDFRAVHHIRTGETRTYTVPAGWLTVRIPGLCVVPAPNTGSTVVHVNSRTCVLA